MNKDQTGVATPADKQQESLESRLNKLLQEAGSLQKSDPRRALDLVARITELAGQAENPDYYLAAAHKAGGNVHFLKAEYEPAKTSYQRALTHAIPAADPKLLGDIHYNLGRVYTALKDYQPALLNLQESLVFRRGLRDKEAEISSLNHLGQVYWDLQDFPEAAAYFQQAAELCDASVSAKKTAAIYNNLGNARIKTGELASAMEAYLYSLKLKETNGDPVDLATAKLNLGNLYYTTTDYAISIQYYQDAASLYREAGDHAREAVVYSNLGAAYSALDDLDQAESSHRKALEYFKHKGMLESYAKSLNSIGAIFHYRSQYQAAIETYQESLQIKSAFHNPESLAITHHNLSECYFCLGEQQSALDHTQISMSYANQIHSKTLLLKNYVQLGKIYAALNDFQNAYEALNSYRGLHLEVYQADKTKVMADMLAQYDAIGKSREIEILKSDQHNLEELIAQQGKDKAHYLKLYRSKLEEVKKRVAIQKKLEQLNAQLESRIQQALRDYQAQQELIIQKSKLESLGVMAAGMAHEINQPLSAIAMSINNLRIKSQKNELSDAYLDDKFRKLTDDIQRIRNVIEHVRQFSRDQVSTIPERIDIHQALRDAAGLLAYDLSKHQIKLRMQLTERSLITVGSKFKLEQVFLNLMSNARDAILDKLRTECPPLPEFPLDIRSSIHGDSAHIEFHDCGTGMSETSINKMFDPFYTTKSPERGTGLGLSISYGIIREMGGKILVKSDAGSFTEITVILPILEEQQ